MRTTLAMVLALIAPYAARAGDKDGGLFISKINEIIEVYVGEKLPNGRHVVVFDLKSMDLHSSAKDYGCIFVSGRAVWIKEYNRENIYIRGEAELPPPGEDIVAYCGVVSHRQKINPHDHAALWQAFVASDCKQFRGKVADRPKWWVKNPILEKYRDNPKPKPRSWGSYPRFKPDEIPAMAAEAVSPTTNSKDRFYIVWGLAISGYAPESAQALVQIACDDKCETTTRDYAAMGLRNFTGGMPEKMRNSIRQRLRKALAAEKADTPVGLIRTLLAWGDAPYVADVLSEKLTGHPMEIEVLQALPGKEASQRLWQMYLEIPKKFVRKQDRYVAAGTIGRALADRKDKRGIDILIKLLPAGTAAPHPQYRHNHFVFLAMKLGNDFGYGRMGGNYSPELEAATPKMVAWWKENRETFSFDAAAKPKEPPRPRAPR